MKWGVFEPSIHVSCCTCTHHLLAASPLVVHADSGGTGAAFEAPFMTCGLGTLEARTIPNTEIFGGRNAFFEISCGLGTLDG